MNAIQFIKEKGIDKARGELNKLPNSNVTHMTNDARMFIDENNPMLDEFQRSQIKDLICIADLKRLVESVERIDGCGGLHGFKTYCNGDFSQEDLQVIADYEAIYLQEKCQHGYDIACLLCGFGTVDGKRVYHGGADSK